MALSDHPTVKGYRERNIKPAGPPGLLPASLLKDMALAAGAADAGLIDLKRETLKEYRQDILDTLPEAQSILVLAFRVGKTHLQSLHHSVADNEFKSVFTETNHAARTIVSELSSKGIQALNMPAGFPFEMGRWPEKVWLTCDKIFAMEAGIGHMGFNRLVLHPRYGAAIVLESILLAGQCDSYDHPIDFNPCIRCGLCLKVCPVGAVKRTDDFDFSACYTHNYREKLGGFINWVEQIAESRSAADYRQKVSDRETVSMWQHLAITSQTRCDRCMAVCPAGEMSIGPYLDDRASYINKNVKRFGDKREPVYVVRGSDAQLWVAERFPKKEIRYVSNGLRPNSVAMFLRSLPMVFQSNRAQGLEAVYHFTFNGKEDLLATVVIREKTIKVTQGHAGTPDLQVTADSETWLSFLNRDTHILMAMLRGKLKIKGKIKLMKMFGDCFPS